MSRLLEVNIGDLVLSNPIMPASGAFGEGMHDIIDFNQLGAVVPKSITKVPRKGNPTPRVCETPSGMINSIGIQSKGIDYYLANTVPFYAKYDSPLIASISADSIEEFAEMTDILASQDSVAAIELNISCPNLKGDGQAFGMSASTTSTLIKQVRTTTNKPLIAKLTPNVTNIQEIAIEAEQAGADALNVANTLLAMSIDVHTMKPKIGNVMGGISGPAVRPVIVRMIYQVYQVVNIPIIGCGGVMTAEDAIEMILAGATAVQVGTASFINPTAMPEIIEGVEKYLNEHGYTTVKDLIGKTHEVVAQKQ